MELSERIRRMELKSFEFWAKRVGTSTDDLIDILIEKINRELLPLYPNPRKAQNSFSKGSGTSLQLKTKEDYFDFAHTSFEGSKASSIELLVEYLDQNVENHHFDFDSIRNMAATLDVSEINTDFPIFLKRFLLKVPVVVLSDLQFTTEVSYSTAFGNIPVVQHYSFLDARLSELLDTTCLLAFEERKVDSEIHLRYRTGFTDRSSGYFKFATKEIGKILLVSTGYVRNRVSYSITRPDTAKGRNMEIRKLSSSLFLNAISFIWIHEFAHILHGDIMKNYWHKEMELRCDALAIKCLLHSSFLKPNNLWSYKPYILVGLDFLFVVLRTLAQLEEQAIKLPEKASVLIGNRGETMHNHIFNTLTNEEREEFDNLSNLLGPLFPSSKTTLSLD